VTRKIESSASDEYTRMIRTVELENDLAAMTSYDTSQRLDDCDAGCARDVHAGCPRWIDVLLALREVAHGLATDASPQLIPREVIMYITYIYFGLIRPMFGYGDDFAIMYNRAVVTWKQWSPCGRMLAFQTDDNNVRLSVEQQVGHQLGRIDHIVCGFDFAIAYRGDARYSWGNNSFGQLGLGDNHRGDRRVQGPSLIYMHSHSRIISISAGFNHVMMITANVPSDGVANNQTQAANGKPYSGSAETSLLGWGSNNNGSLGLDNECNVYNPRVLGVGGPLAAICVGGRSLVLTRDGVYLYGHETTPNASTARPVRLEFPNSSGPISRIHLCCRRAFVQTDSVWLGNSVHHCSAKKWLNGRRAVNFDTIPQCCALDFLEDLNGDLMQRLPGKILSISGGEVYLIITTTRGVFSYVEISDSISANSERLCLMCEL
jgi:hypothetical protein